MQISFQSQNTAAKLQQLLTIRKERGLSDTELAHLCQTNRNRIRCWRSGENITRQDLESVMLTYFIVRGVLAALDDSWPETQPEEETAYRLGPVATSEPIMEPEATPDIFVFGEGFDEWYESLRRQQHGT